MNDLKIFENDMFGQLTIINSDEHGILFLGYEVAQMAGYKKPKDAVLRLADKYKFRLSYHEAKQLLNESAEIQNNGLWNLSPNGITLVNEPGLYKLASGKNEAFENWIFFEVLPSIRKEGQYQLDNVIQKQLETTIHGIKILTGIEPEELARVQNESWRAKLANLINDIAKREQTSTKGLYEKLYYLFAGETGFHIPDLAEKAGISNSEYLRQNELSAKMLYEFGLGYFYKDKRFLELISLNPNQRTLSDFGGM